MPTSLRQRANAEPPRHSASSARATRSPASLGGDPSTPSAGSDILITTKRSSIAHSTRYAWRPSEATAPLGSCWRALRSLPHGVANATFFVARVVHGIGWNVSIAAPIAEDGTIGEWFATERAPNPGAVAVWGDHGVHVAGGWAGVWSQRDDVWAAELRGDGTLSGWRSAGTRRSTAKVAAVAARGTIFIIGGERGGKVCRPDGASRNEDIDFLDDVEAATIRADGTLGRFRIAAKLSEAAAIGRRRRRRPPLRGRRLWTVHVERCRLRACLR